MKRVKHIRRNVSTGNTFKGTFFGKSDNGHSILQRKEEGFGSFFTTYTHQGGSTSNVLQTKPDINSGDLQVGQPGDKYEVEADTMADTVVQRLANKENTNTPFFTTGNTTHSLQTKCEQDVQVKGNQNMPVPDITSKLNSTKGGGRPLSQNVNENMSSAFGADFSMVKVHTGSEAVQMSQELNAQAFTHGQDIYFNRGRYKPESSTGQHLLAHELTYAVQQQDGSLGIQRQAGDKHDLTSTMLAGDPKLEKSFDGEAIVKKPAQGDHVLKLQNALLHLGIDVSGFKANSKYDNATANAVRDFQRKAGMSFMEQDGIIGKKTLGLLDMSVRNDQVEADTDQAAEDFTVSDDSQKAKDEACKGQPTEAPCTKQFLIIVDKGADAAISMIDKVLTEQLPPVKTKDADYPLIFSQIFRKNDNRPLADTVDEVRNHYITIKDFVGKLKTDRSHVRCATECDGGCRSGVPAYRIFDKNINKNVIKFCPEFEKHPQRTEIVLHECHHASIPNSRDKAYADTRLFDKIDHKTALINAASFHTYAAWVTKPGSENIGPDIKDANLIDDTTQKERVDLALGHIHQWFALIPFDMSTTVQGAQEAHDEGVYKSNNAQVFMERVFSKWFELTPPPKPPKEAEVDKLKAIEERLDKMDTAFESPFLILETTQDSFWERGPGTGIAPNDELLLLDLDHMIIALLQELVSATPDISADLESVYVLTINDMRNLRSLDP